VIRTRFTELVGCTVPIQLAGMPRTATPELAAAVCRAGGLGMIGGTRYSAGALGQALDELAGGANGAPFGVNFLVPFLDREAVRAAARRARVVELFWGDPDPGIVDDIHAEGALAAWQVGSVAEAQAAAAVGCDFVIAQGVEAGGHVRGTTRLLDLLAEVVAQVSVPVVAAGGIGSPAAMAAALAAGAEGVRVGTLFVAAAESGAHPDYQRALIAASAGDTIVTETFSHMWPDAPHRVLRASAEAATAGTGEFVAEIHEGGRVVPVPRFATPNPTRTTVGDVAAMPHYAGTSVDGVADVRPAADIIRALVEGVTARLR
jgi:nitronate monooxygenase